MEIRTYLGSLLRYWWIIVLTALVAGGVAYMVDRGQAPTYSTHVRVAMRPSSIVSDPRDIVNLVGEIGARNLTGTFAEAFTSQQVRTDAQKAAGLTADQADAYSVDASVLPDTTVIDVEASGPNPTLLVAYLQATITAAVDNTRDLFRVLDLVPLDQAAVPTTPSAPTPARDTALAAALGAAAGVLLALALDYLRENRREPETVRVPSGTGRRLTNLERG